MNDMNINSFWSKSLTDLKKVGEEVFFNKKSPLKRVLSQQDLKIKNAEIFKNSLYHQKDEEQSSIQENPFPRLNEDFYAQGIRHALCGQSRKSQSVDATKDPQYWKDMTTRLESKDEQLCLNAAVFMGGAEHLAAVKGSNSFFVIPAFISNLLELKTNESQKLSDSLIKGFNVVVESYSKAVDEAELEIKDSKSSEEEMENEFHKKMMENYVKHMTEKIEESFKNTHEDLSMSFPIDKKYGENGSHALILQIHREGGLYKISVYNSGLGINHHQAKYENGKEYYSLSYTLENVDESRLFEKLTSMINSEKTVDELYKNLQDLGGKIKPASERDWAKPQLGGSCTAGGIFALARSNLSSKGFHAFKYKINKEGILKYRTILKKIGGGESLDATILNEMKFKLNYRGNKYGVKTQVEENLSEEEQKYQVEKTNLTLEKIPNSLNECLELTFKSIKTNSLSDAKFYLENIYQKFKIEILDIKKIDTLALLAKNLNEFSTIYSPENTEDLEKGVNSQTIESRNLICGLSYFLYIQLSFHNRVDQEFLTQIKNFFYDYLQLKIYNIKPQEPWAVGIGVLFTEKDQGILFKPVLKNEEINAIIKNVDELINFIGRVFGGKKGLEKRMDVHGKLTKMIENNKDIQKFAGVIQYKLDSFEESI